MCRGRKNFAGAVGVGVLFCWMVATTAAGSDTGLSETLGNKDALYVSFDSETAPQFKLEMKKGDALPGITDAMVAEQLTQELTIELKQPLQSENDKKSNATKKDGNKKDDPDVGSTKVTLPAGTVVLPPSGNQKEWVLKEDLEIPASADDQQTAKGTESEDDKAKPVRVKKDTPLPGITAEMVALQLLNNQTIKLKSPPQNELKDAIEVNSKAGPRYLLSSGTPYVFTDWPVELIKGTKVAAAATSSDHKYVLNQNVELSPPANKELDLTVQDSTIVQRIPGSGPKATVEIEPKRARVGGYVKLTIKKSGFDFTKAEVLVSLRDPDSGPDWHKSNDVQLIDSSVGEHQARVRIPEIDSPGEVELLVVARQPGADYTEALSRDLEVASFPLALWLSGGTIAGIWILLVWLSRDNGEWTWRAMNPVRFAAGKHGRASLSRAQIGLWTVLVLTASVYLLVISDSLMELTPQILMLLGIQGGTSVISSITASTKNKEGNLIVAPKQQEPEWSHLIQTEGKTDLFKVQMALFTLLAAGFVVYSILRESAFPSLPKGLVTMIGLSSGVYLFGKGTTKTAAQEVVDLQPEVERKRSAFEKLGVQAVGQSLTPEVSSQRQKRLSAAEDELEEINKRYKDAVAKAKTYG